MDEAIMLQKLVGMPSTHNLKEAVQNNQTRNCPITTDDIIIAETIDDPGHMINCQFHQKQKEMCKTSNPVIQ